MARGRAVNIATEVRLCHEWTSSWLVGKVIHIWRRFWSDDEQPRNYRAKYEYGRSRASEKSPAVMFVYGYSAGLLLFACSCASSDSASLPLRLASVTSVDS